MSAQGFSRSPASSRWIVLSVLAVIGVLVAATYSYWGPLAGGVQNSRRGPYRPTSR